MIYKRCSHRRGRPQDTCAHPWYGSFNMAGHPRARVALATWAGQPVETRQQALAIFDELKAAVRAGRFYPRGRSMPASRSRTLTLRQLAQQYFDKVAAHASHVRSGTYWSRLRPALTTFGDIAIDQFARP
jgi:hypothetical protein